MFAYIKEDIRAVLNRDPAARNAFEVILCYSGFHAIILHRIAYWLFNHKLKLLARLV